MPGYKKGTSFWDRLSAKVVRDTERGCLLWTGAKDGKGYGTIRDGNKHVSLHRAVWQRQYGPISMGMGVCHHCDTPACIELTHLFLGTPKDNAADRDRKGRMPSQKGEHNAYAKWRRERTTAAACFHTASIEQGPAGMLMCSMCGAAI